MKSAFYNSSLTKPAQLRTTPLYEFEQDQGGWMLPWRGQLMPSHYTSVLEEHMAAHNDLALFDLGYRGLGRVEGRGATALINRLSTVEATEMKIGEMVEVPFVYPDGTLVDLVRMIREEEEMWLLSFASPQPQKIFDWIRQEASGGECWVNDLSAQYAWLGLVGPRAQEYMVCGNPAFERLKPKHITEGLVAGVAAQIFRPSKDFYAIACRPELLPKIVHSWWIGDEERPRLCGWASYENWRMEKGVMRYGYELIDGVSPWELGLDDKIDLSREHFVGRSALIAQQKAGLERLLIHFCLNVARLPRHQAPIYCGERRVGFVCAGGYSPVLRCPIGSAWVETQDVDFDSLTVELRRQRFEITVKRPPFA